MTDQAMTETFDITWRNGAYYVSVPNYQGGTVYTSDHVETLKDRIGFLEYHGREREETLVEKEARIQVLTKVAEDALVDMRHARTFISSREKMHPVGVDMFNQAIESLEAALNPQEKAND